MNETYQEMKSSCDEIYKVKLMGGNVCEAMREFAIASLLLAVDEGNGLSEMISDAMRQKEAKKV